jgi:hypothetical protein
VVNELREEIELDELACMMCAAGEGDSPGNLDKANLGFDFFFLF